MSDKAEGRSESSSSVQGKGEKIDGPSSPKRIKLTDSVNDVKKMSRESLLSKFQEQDKYVNHLEEKVNKSSNAGELTSLRESEEKLKLQQQESTRRENVLVMRLATKEQEMQELLTQIHDLKQAQNPAGAQLRSTLLDPAVNIVFQRMKSELDETKEKLEQAQNDLSAWKFTPDSVTGKKLMAKCRMLIQENQELGRQLSQGRVAQLEAELALQKKYSEELKTSQDELNEFVIQLDDEVEGMQSTILTLQKQLKGVKNELVDAKQSSEKHVEQIRILEQNLDLARTQPPSPVDSGKPGTVEDMQCDVSDKTDVKIENQESAHDAMEFECNNKEPGKDNTNDEDKDTKFHIVESELKNVKPDPDGVLSSYDNEASVDENFQPVIRTNEFLAVKDEEPEIRGEKPENPNMQEEVRIVLPDVKNEYPEIRDVQAEFEDNQSNYSELQADVRQAQAEMRNVLTDVNNVFAGVTRIISRAENENPDKNNIPPTIENVMTGQENVQLGGESTTTKKEYSKNVTESLKTEDSPPRSFEKANQFSSPLEPNLRKSAGTPPCSTTFSISQILGEPKRTPSPDIPPGGDAVVTKIPYIGGYTDTAGDTLRTEGSGLLNGEGKDGTPPLVTQRVE